MGTLTNTGDLGTSLWDRICLSAVNKDDYSLLGNVIRLPWPGLLSLIREFGPQQKKRRFRFRQSERARPEIQKFMMQLRSVMTAGTTQPVTLSADEINSRLSYFGFTKRTLRPFQIRDLQQLLALGNGANFSVPGAGKTTVTFALHLLTRDEGRKLVILSPKSAFGAWTDVVMDCVSEVAPPWVREPFQILTGNAGNVRHGLQSDSNRIVLNYEQLLSIPNDFLNYLARHRVHLVLDEAHRVKGGTSVKRGTVLLNAATLPVRRDILTGTPMPQSPADLQSQFEFLWPGSGLSVKIAAERRPRDVISNLYVRTTKQELGLPPVKRHFITVEMGRGQSALHAIVRREELRNLSSLKSGSGADVRKARRSVIRLLQLSTNPVLAATSMLNSAPQLVSGIVNQVFEDGPSPKMVAVRDHARLLARKGRKTVIWTVFVDTIEQMRFMLADLNPAVVYGQVASGDPDDPQSREGQIDRFLNDPTCMTFIANPAAVGEGISLHHICHDAIYLDRSYNTTHYVQSIDRIHRLGLPSDTKTNIFIFQTKAAKGLGSIDHSVSRRLATKVRAMQQLLNDSDLNELALDEEESPEAIDYHTDTEDLVDLIHELEGNAAYLQDEEF